MYSFIANSSNLFVKEITMGTLAFSTDVIKVNVDLFNRFSRLVLGKLVNFVKNDGSSTEPAYYLGKDEDGRVWVKTMGDMSEHKPIVVGLLPEHYQPTAFVLDNGLTQDEMNECRNRIETIRMTRGVKEFRKKFKRNQGCHCCFVKNDHSEYRHSGYLLGFDHRGRVWMLNKTESFEVCFMSEATHHYRLESVDYADRLSPRSDNYREACEVALKMSF